MKRSIGILLIVLMLGFSGNTQNAPFSGKNNYVVSTTKIPQLQPILLTAASLKEEDGKKYGDFQIVMYGANLKGLTEKDKIEEYVFKAKAAGAQILVCKLSLEKLNIDPKDLHKDVKVVDHAFTHLLQLQKDKKYYSLQL